MRPFTHTCSVRDKKETDTKRTKPGDNWELSLKLLAAENSRQESIYTVPTKINLCSSPGL